jgi:hypothetical protein
MDISWIIGMIFLLWAFDHFTTKPDMSISIEAIEKNGVCLELDFSSDRAFEILGKDIKSSGYRNLNINKDTGQIFASGSSSLFDEAGTMTAFVKENGNKKCKVGFLFKLKQSSQFPKKEEQLFPDKNYQDVRATPILKSLTLHLKLDFYDNQFPFSEPLLNAAYEGNNQLIGDLIRKGTDLNVTDELDITPLMAAILNGQTQVVKLLLDRGVDVNLKNRHGDTALALSSIKGFTDIEEILRKAEAKGGMSFL